MLGIPTKTQHIEPVEERGEAARPVLLSKVDRFDPGGSQFGSATLGTKLHRIQGGRVHEVSIRSPVSPCLEHLKVGMADPETIEGVMRAGCLDERVERGRILHVDTERKVGANCAIELGKRRNVGLEFGPIHLANPASRKAAVPPVVVEHNLTISGHPGIGFDPGGAEPDCKFEGVNRVIPGVRFRPPVSEQHGRAPHRRNASAHSCPSWQFSVRSPPRAIKNPQPTESSEPVKNPGSKSLNLGRGHADGVRTRVTTRSDHTMATIRASCETCGDVELTTADVRVRVCTSDNRGEYSFRCPDCDMTVVKGAEPRTIDLLVASGVQLDTWSLPAELGEIKNGRPINHDDLLEFHDKLHDSGSWNDALSSLLDT